MRPNTWNDQFEEMKINIMLYQCFKCIFSFVVKINIVNHIVDHWHFPVKIIFIVDTSIIVLRSFRMCP